MNKENLRRQILEKLETDHQLLLRAAQSSHQAATHEENIPDSKYETLALESSYIAQGQANRAQEIKQSISAIQKMTLQDFSEQTPIRLSALVHLEDENGNTRLVFLAPAAGGMTLEHEGETVMLITPDSPLGCELIGSRVDNCITIASGGGREYEIVEVA